MDSICAFVLKEKLMFSFDTLIGQDVENYMAHEGYTVDLGNKKGYFLCLKSDIDSVKLSECEIIKVKVMPRSFHTQRARGEYKLK